MKRYLQLSTYLRHRFRNRVQKIPLDAGGTCPNRDGTLSRAGCIFCNPSGSGSGMDEKGHNLSEQWTFWREKYNRNRNAGLFIAYLQSFSNTYGPLKTLKSTLSALTELSGLVGISIGTRPDCVDEDKLDAIADAAKQGGWSEVWIEYGLQSSNDATLARINRGHTFTDFTTATLMAAERGINVCAHVIAGLPQETDADFIKTVQDVNRLPVKGIKFHSLYVPEHTALAHLWRSGSYTPLTEDAYLEMLLRAIPILRSDLIIQRLTGDAAEGELLAPDWPQSKRVFLARIDKELTDRDIWQGKECDAPEAPPLWYNLRQNISPKLHYKWDQQYKQAATAMRFIIP